MTNPEGIPGNLEIERRFLVKPSETPPVETGVRLTQGYLASSDRASVRVRVVEGQDVAFLTVKSRHTGIARYEYDYPIPLSDGRDFLFSFCERLIEKVRTPIFFGGYTWVVDRFLGANTGLCIAECELPSADVELSLPEWCGLEVTDDNRFRNDRLAVSPISTWTSTERKSFEEIG